MHMSFLKKGICYVIRFSQERPDSKESNKNTVIYFNKQKNIIGFDIYPPQEESTS